MSQGGREGRTRPPYWLYAGLTLLVWGAFAFERGFWQDDGRSLSRLLGMDLGSLGTYLAAGAAETRRLKSALYALALAGGRPVETLQVAYGAIWLGIGVLLDRVAARFFPSRARLSLMAGALVLCATGDLLTDSLAMLGYNLALLSFLGALYCLLRWTDGGRWPWLVASPLLAFASVSVNEGALVSLVVAPAMVIVAHGRSHLRRVGAGLAAWAGVLGLHLAGFVHFLAKEHYADIAFVPLTPVQRLERVAWLFGENFAPWRWVFSRPRWISAEAPHILPPWWPALVAAAATTLFVVALARRGSRAAERPAGRREWLLVALFLGTALLSNAAFSGLVLSEFLYRTQAASRVWSSLAVAALVDLPRWPPGLARRLVVGVPVAFVAFGAAGGGERQDYYTAVWSEHRRELVSILDQVPDLAPNARLLLYLPADRRYEATEVLYLTRSWMALLYDDPSMAGRSFLWAGHDLVGCQPRPEGLGCWDEGHRERFLRGEVDGWRVRYEDLVLLAWDRDSGRYELVPSLPDERLPIGAEGAEAYRPLRNVRPGAMSALTRAILVDAARAPRAAQSR